MITFENFVMVMIIIIVKNLANNNGNTVIAIPHGIRENRILCNLQIYSHLTYLCHLQSHHHLQLNQVLTLNKLL
jgi:hypothetical protein